MKPAIRTQVDDRQDEISLATGLDTSDRPDLTRQEFREEADTNYLLSRFGVNVPMQRTPQFGEIDFDLDLHSAHIAVDRAQNAWYQLSEDLREKYKDPAGMLDAMNSGQLEEDLKAERRKAALEKREAAEDEKEEVKAKRAAKAAAPAPGTPQEAVSPPDLTPIIKPLAKSPQKGD